MGRDRPARSRWVLVAAAVFWCIVQSVRAQGGAALVEPPVLENRSTEAGIVEVALTASPARVFLMPGRSIHL
jgi:hypothetical protein